MVPHNLGKLIDVILFLRYLTTTEWKETYGGHKEGRIQDIQVDISLLEKIATLFSSKDPCQLQKTSV